MKVFIFDLLPYGEELKELAKGGELPYPLSSKYFNPQTAVRSYEEHLTAWEEMDRLGYDGVGFNEHHCSPYGLMNSPNLLAAAASQRTKKLKLLIYGNLLPLHEPLRLAEELAMLDCLSNGRLISGFARGIPREYQVHNVPLSDSRERFEEAFEIVRRAWAEEVFSYKGKFWSYENVSIWPRPVQQPTPPVWIPVTGSKESIEFAARNNLPITPGLRAGGLQQDIIRYYASRLAAYGHAITPDHLSVPVNVYIADSKEQAVKENAPHYLYFNRTLFSHGNFTETSLQRAAGYSSTSSTDYVRPENLKQVAYERSDFRNMTLEDVKRSAENLPWGSAGEIVERLLKLCRTTGASTIQISLNRGVMPQEMFLEQIRRIAREVLPALQAENIAAVPLEAEFA